MNLPDNLRPRLTLADLPKLRPVLDRLPAWVPRSSVPLLIPDRMSIFDRSTSVRMSTPAACRCCSPTATC